MVITSEIESLYDGEKSKAPQPGASPFKNLLIYVGMVIFGSMVTILGKIMEVKLPSVKD